MVFPGHDRGVDDRIVAPDADPLAEAVRDPANLFDCGFILDDGLLECPRIRIDGMLDDERETHPLDFGEVFDERTDVFGPEDNSVGLVRLQIHVLELTVIGIHNHTVSCLQAVHEPLAVEGRNVCSIAGRDDHETRMAVSEA